MTDDEICAWALDHIARPRPVYLVADLVRLSGITRHQLWRWLAAKGVLDVDPTQHRVHMVDRSKLDAAWPEFWQHVRAKWLIATTATERLPRVG